MRDASNTPLSPLLVVAGGNFDPLAETRRNHLILLIIPRWVCFAKTAAAAAAAVGGAGAGAAAVPCFWRAHVAWWGCFAKLSRHAVAVAPRDDVRRCARDRMVTGGAPPRRVGEMVGSHSARCVGGME